MIPRDHLTHCIPAGSTVFSAILFLLILPSCAQIATGTENPITEPAKDESAASVGKPPASGPREAAAAPLPSKMVGRITVEGTGEPLVGATILVFLGKIDSPAGGNVQRTGRSDAQGRYSIDIPAGHARAWFPKFPPGYWSDKYDANDDFVTTAQKSVYTKNYVVQRAPVWQIHVRQNGRPVSGLPCSVLSARQLESGYLFSSCDQTDERGIARLTIPVVVDDFKISLLDVEYRFQRREPVHVQCESGFHSDETSAIQADSRPDMFRLKDKQGKTATLTGARVIRDNGALRIDLDVHPLEPTALGNVTGGVVDENDRPVAGATVALGMNSGQSSMMTELAADSDANGRFVIQHVPTKELEDATTRLFVVVTKDGYAGLDSKPNALPVDKKRPLDLGRIRLAHGRSIRVRVVGPGAWVTPRRSFANRRQLTVTDAEGECVVRNLSEGLQDLSAEYGNLRGHAMVVVGDQSAQTTIYLKPIKPVPRFQASRSAAAKPVKPGEPAPALEVAGWTDGRTRTLADFGGKVVVLDFWGIWCGPCVRAIPVLKDLQAKYKGRDVVFLAIHSADTRIEQVREFQRQQKWEAFIGSDKGEDVASSATAGKYGVHGFPTLIVIGRDGRVCFNTDAVDREAGMKSMERIAKTLSIPWPLNEKAPEEQLIDKVSRIQAYLFSEAIDQALAKH
jgi:thiol-disulfide isomerase/thioredoxin